MKYYAFGFDERPNGGLYDIIATYDTLNEAKAAIEQEAPNHAYWHGYKGHIAIIKYNRFKIVLYYAAKLVGNIYGGRIDRQVWTETSTEYDAFLAEIP